MGTEKFDIEKIKENVQVEDSHILLGRPLEIYKYGKKIEIAQVKYMIWEDYIFNLGMFLQRYYVVCAISELPDSLNELMEFRKNLQMAMGDKKSFQYLVKILKLQGLKYRWMKKMFTIDDYIEIFIYSYVYNVRGVKLGCKTGLNILKRVA